LDSKEAAYKLLRQFLNPSIQGPNTTAILQALAEPASSLIDNIQAINDNLFIVSAEEKYLDALFAGEGLSRPNNIGLYDEDFKNIGVEVINRKQIRDLFEKILEIIYGAEYTRASIKSANLEPYNLSEGDSLKVSFDDSEIIEIFFSSSQFSDISNASAQEVADAFTRGLRKKGYQGYATVSNDGSGNYLSIFSPSLGPSSNITVWGGKAQNVLNFPALRNTTQNVTTQWDLTIENGGLIRALWVGGANPNLGKAKAGDYVNIFGTNFSLNNRGSFNIIKVQGGLVNEAYFEFYNPLGLNETVTQGTLEDVLFYYPKKFSLLSNSTFAAIFQTENKILQVFIPAITRVIRREKIGSIHLKDSASPVATTFEDSGSYFWDQTKPYAISSIFTSTSAILDSSSNTLIEVGDSSNFKESGYLCLGYGTAHEEGPVPYLNLPSSGTIQVSPAYTFKKSHPSGTDVSMIGVNSSYKPDQAGKDYGMYLTGIAEGRTYLLELMDLVQAFGISLIVTVLYPNSIGLGNYGRLGDEKVKVFG
jgi:hypothetical protein